MRQEYENDLAARAKIMHAADALPTADTEERPIITLTDRMRQVRDRYGSPIENLLYNKDIGETNVKRAESLRINVSTLRRWQKNIPRPSEAAQDAQPAPIIWLELRHLSQTRMELYASGQRTTGAQNAYTRLRARSSLEVGPTSVFTKFRKKPFSYRESLEAARKRYEEQRKENIIRESSKAILEGPTQDFFEMATNRIAGYRGALVRKAVEGLGYLDREQQDTVRERAKEAVMALPHDASLQEIVHTLSSFLPDDPQHKKLDRKKMRDINRDGAIAIGVTLLALIAAFTLIFARHKEVPTPAPSAQVTMQPGVEYTPAPLPSPTPSLRDSFSYSNWQFDSLDPEGNLPNLKGAFDRELGEKRYNIKGEDGTFDPFDGKQKEEFDKQRAQDTKAQDIENAYLFVLFNSNPPDSFENPGAPLSDLQARLKKPILAPSLDQIIAMVERGAVVRP